MSAEEFWKTPLTRFTDLIVDYNSDPNKEQQMTREQIVRGEREIILRWNKKI